MEMKNKIIEYMNEQEVSVDEISEGTKISKDKFQKESNVDMTASEMLSVCAYLGVDPERFYTRKIGKGGILCSDIDADRIR